MTISQFATFEKAANFPLAVKLKLIELVTAVNSGGGASAWGTITGTLSAQTDLQTALNGKQAAGSYAASSHAHTAAQITDFGTAVTTVVDAMGLGGGGGIDGGAASSTFGGLTAIDGGNASG